MRNWFAQDRLLKLVTLMVVAQTVGFSTGCSPARPATTVERAGASIGTPNLPKAASPVRNPNALCDRIGEIKVISFHPEDAEDPVYLEFVKAGDSVVPCLIEKITDATPTPDPREAPHEDTAIGDIAYFLVVDITHLDFTAVLPDAVKADYKVEGVRAYFRYVASPENRSRLQDRLRTWYRQRPPH